MTLGGVLDDVGGVLDAVGEVLDDVGGALDAVGEVLYDVVGVLDDVGEVLDARFMLKEGAGLTVQKYGLSCQDDSAKQIQW